MKNVKLSKCWSCDFETTTDETDCRVWAWIAVNLENNENFELGNTIESFIAWLGTSSKTIYFHNLKFDGTFILDHILRNGWKLNKEKKQLKPGEFNTLINDKGFFYTMSMKFEKAFIEIIDSLKIINSSVDNIAKGWKLPISKLSIDYTEKREKGHILTEEEKAYIINDAKIIAIAMRSLLEQKMTKITAGSNAFHYYVDTCCHGKKNFRKLFPIPQNDEFIRKAYRGGYSYVNPIYQNRDIGEGRVYDVNSLYPFALHSPHLYPYGEGQYYIGEYKPNKTFPLYVCHIIAHFSLKENHLPMIQLKKNPLFIPTEYITDSKEDVELYLTSVDFELFKDQYNIDDIRFIDGFMYQGKEGLFDSYIDHWYKTKSESKHEGNYAMYQLSKLMLNSFYGKMATNPIVSSRWPEIDKDKNIVVLKPGEPETKEPIYIPVGVFCTAYARDVTIRAAQSCFERFCYADTDSLHVIGDYDVEGLPVDDYKLGYFKHESTFTRARYLRAKLYAEEIDGKLDVKGAGMTKAVKDQVTMDNFNYGTVFSGKLQQITVPGGIVLKDTTFNIKQH